MVFQNYALYPQMTVRKNMAFGLKMRGTPRAQIDRKVAETASMLGIDHLLDRKPAALSGGGGRGVGVGGAGVRQRQVFVFDEPLASRDAKLRAQMRTELKSLHRALKTTMLYVTHDQEEAMTMGDRIAVMDRGIMRQCGTPLDIYDRPADRFVAGFIGTPSMNFLSGTIERDASASCFVGPIGRLALTVDMANALKPSSCASVVLGLRPEHPRLAGPRALSANGAAKHDDPTHPVCEPSGSSYHAPRDQNGSVVVETLVVDMVEHLGDSINVYLKVPPGEGGPPREGEPPGEPLVARVPPTTDVSRGQRVRAFVDMSRVHVFATDSDGKRLA